MTAPQAIARARRSETFAEARTRLLDLLGKEGWKVTAHLKIPKAQKGEWTLWFKPQAVYMGQHNNFGDARSMHIDDIRDMSTDAFMASVACDLLRRL